MQYESCRALLKSYFLEKKQANPLFSLRAFALRLNTSPATLSQVMACKRPLTLKLAKRVAEELALHPQAKRDIFANLSESGSGEAQAYNELSAHEFEVISQWLHVSVLTLARINIKLLKPEVIARKFGVTPQEAQASLGRLEKIGCLERTKRGGWRLLKSAITTSSNVPSIAIKKFHREMLNKADIALANQPMEHRDFSGITVAIDKRKIPEAKKMIQEFRRSLADFLQSDIKEEVYQVCIQMFSLEKKSS